MLQIDDICVQARSYLNPDDVGLVRRAYEFGAEAHQGQHRVSGEPYIQHPLEVASILAEMHMDHETLAAAMLHDVLEDTGTGKDTISKKFGGDIAGIVDGLSKLTQIEFDSYEDAQAQNIQKMLMAMTSDIRVILVKLADRLHNMRTIRALSIEKRRRIARETLDIYAPIAQRLGLNMIRLELEELGFSALYPMRHRVLAEQVRKARGNRKEIINKIKNGIRRRLRQEKIRAQVFGREKHLYSIYKKMRNKHLSFAEVYDVYAFRLLVESADTCYRVIGTVHNLYKPLPGKFKDYIAIPKVNGYQSLHTVLFGPYGVPIEVQIRTQEMDEIAEGGIAAHWLYKSGGASKNAHKRAGEWLSGLLEMQRQAGNSQEFLEHFKIDLFPHEVYVFTPKGDIMELPQGATPVDLAYAIHTDVGNGCVAARIDRRLAPLRTPLETGQTVEIVTAPGARPNPAWLNFVATSRARSHIRHFLKNIKRDEARTLGRRMLNRELEAVSLNLDTVNKRQLRNTIKELKVESLDDLLEEIGLGNRMAPLVARALLPGEKDKPQKSKRTTNQAAPLIIEGTEGMVVSFPKCCHPIPGDSIMGYLSAGRGLVIHHHLCRNVAEFRNQPEKWVDVAWAKNIETEFSAEIHVEVTNQRGALATIAQVIADQQANIDHLEMFDRDGRYVEFIFVITVRDRQHLARLIRRVRSVKHVSRVSRTKG